MDRDGVLFVAIPLLVAIAAAYFGIWIVAGVFLTLAAFMLYFFRDPKRITPEGDGLIISSAETER